VLLLLLPRHLVEESALGGGEAVDALLADLVEHAVHLGGDRIGIGATARADRHGRRAPVGLGAASATFVELNPPSLLALKANVATLGVADRATVHRGDALRYVEGLPAGAFDVALADPPYARDDAARLVALFRWTPFARILSVEHSAAERLDGDSTRRYGDTALTFFHAP